MVYTGIKKENQSPIGYIAVSKFKYAQRTMIFQADSVKNLKACHSRNRANDI